jgi:hypothetical protein
MSIELNNKSYDVRHDDYGNYWISTTWDVMIPSTASSARPKYASRYATIDVHGKIGKKVMAKYHEMVAKEKANQA